MSIAFYVCSLIHLSFHLADGDETDPFPAHEEEKPKEEVSQVSSPQPASPTGSEARVSTVGFTALKDITEEVF